MSTGSVHPFTSDKPPYLLPPNWKWVRLGDVCDLISGRDLMPDQYNSIQRGIPYITGASNLEDGHILINRWTQHPITIAKRGDLLLSCKGTVGKLAFLNEPEVHIARQIMALRAKEGILLGYICRVIELNVDMLKAQAKSMIPGIDRKAMLGLMIPLPPLAEQKRIVVKVEELLNAVKGLSST